MPPSPELGTSPISTVKTSESPDTKLPRSSGPTPSLFRIPDLSRCNGTALPFPQRKDVAHVASGVRQTVD
jgi:hypothetical protein